MADRVTLNYTNTKLLAVNIRKKQKAQYIKSNITVNVLVS